MSTARIVALTSLAMIAFAGNSLLCRVDLKDTSIDAASFTTIRLISGAVTLWLVARMSRGTRAGRGMGALLLFGAVQATMIAHGLGAGERLQSLQRVGLVLALGGLVGLLMPGLSAPPLHRSSQRRFAARLSLIVGLTRGP